MHVLYPHLQFTSGAKVSIKEAECTVEKYIAQPIFPFTTGR